MRNALIGMSLLMGMAALAGCAGTDGAPTGDDDAPAAEQTRDGDQVVELPDFELEKRPKADAGAPEPTAEPKVPQSEPDFCPVHIEESGYNNSPGYAHVFPTACSHNRVTGKTSRLDADYFKFTVPADAEVLTMTATGAGDFMVYAPGSQIAVGSGGETRLPVVPNAEYLVEVKSSVWTATAYELSLHIEP